MILNMKKILVLLILSFQLVLCRGSSSKAIPVTISQQGGYSVLLAISKNVEENLELISILKDLFTKASDFLYNATRRNVYFEEVTIALPSNWEHKPQYEVSLRDQLQDAHFRVDLPDEEFGEEPFTRQPEGCGRPGLFVHLTPSYLDTLELTVSEFGIPERRLVHEWAHYRYGVYDEKPSRRSFNSRAYYRYAGRMLPTLCSSELGNSGVNVKGNGDFCNPTEENPKDCSFRVENDYVTSKASIMYSTSVPSIDSFCDYTRERKHNVFALNEQNHQCKSRSTWDVISKHEDFKRLRPVLGVVTTPRFRIVRSTGEKGKSVLLLDISGSMAGVPIQRLHETAKFSVLEKSTEDSFLGIVAFGTHSKELHNLVQVNPTTRATLSESLPQEANGGGTGIGEGLQTALSVLRGPSGMDPVEGGVIVLITDGEENKAPFLKDVLPELVSSRVGVNVIAYGENASVLMEKLATSTGGNLALFSKIHDAKADTSELINQISKAITLHSDVELEPVSVASKAIKLTSKETSIRAVLDDELGRNTYFTFSGADMGTVEVELISPSNAVFGRLSPQYKRESNGRITFYFQEAETGQYSARIFLSSNDNIQVNFALVSEVKDPKKQPIRVNTWIDEIEVAYPAVPKVFAQVKKGAKPVLKAIVTTDIIGPNTMTSITLKDDGANPDVFKNDGIYSAYLAGVDGNHRYQVISYVKKGKKTRIRIKKHRKNMGNRRKRAVDHDEKSTDGWMSSETEEEQEEEEETEEEPVKPFERVSEAGVFRVQGFKPNLGDIQAPGDVSDLRIVSIQDENVTLAWTSPGDDNMLGNATWIYLRGSPVFDTLQTRFNQIGIFGENDSFEWTLEPVPSGETQYVTLFIPQELRQIEMSNSSETRISSFYFFALKAVDEENNTAEISNIVYAVFYKKPSVVVVVETTLLPNFENVTLINGTLDDKPDNHKASESFSTGLLIGIVMVIILTLTVLAGVVSYIMKSRNKLNTGVTVTEQTNYPV